jgi:hypothetical protein
MPCGFDHRKVVCGKPHARFDEGGLVSKTSSLLYLRGPDNPGRGICNVRKLRESDFYLTRKRYERFLKQHEGNKRRRNVKSSAPSFKSAPINLLNTLPFVDIFRPHHHKLDINIPEKFSIIDNPKETLKVICSFPKTIRTYDQRIREISVDHGKMKQVDLAAESILDFLILDMEREEKQKKKKTKCGGHLPPDAKLIRYLRSVGIIKNLDVKHEMLSKEDESNLRIFRMKNRGALENVSSGTSDIKERTVKEFVDHINSCLNDHRLELTVSGRASLSQYTGEILGNAEEHSGLRDWTIAGYLDKEHEAHMSEIAIFNFGKTIAETFKDLPFNSYAYEIVRPYVDAHKKYSFFGTSWTEDDLLTLVALQGHISSKSTRERPDRGQGTVDLIEFFQNVHQECIKEAEQKCQARMAIVSGNTHILFDGTYTMQDDSLGRKVIAFNKDNDLNQPPDANYVTNMGDVFFPGVIIGIRFPMAASQTKEVKNG